MPELPEVETTRRGVLPYVLGQRVERVLVRERRLRWPIPHDLEKVLEGGRIDSVARRGKYLLFQFEHGTLIVHLGMSGSLRMLPAGSPAAKHEHFDVVLANGQCMRYTDPRRFGAALWVTFEPLQHPLLRVLGVEPLTDEFTAVLLRQLFANSSQPVKLALMDSHRVVGVGNIYANESLFRAGIRPTTPANRVSLARLEKLVQAVKVTLQAAIDAGGSTLRDFVGGDGKPGYFQQQYFVYGRGGQPCRVCGTLLKEIRLGQRATCYCLKCQK